MLQMLACLCLFDSAFLLLTGLEACRKNLGFEPRWYLLFYAHFGFPLR